MTPPAITSITATGGTASNSVSRSKPTASAPFARWCPSTSLPRAEVSEGQRLRRLTGELIEVSEQLSEARLRSAAASVQREAS